MKPSRPYIVKALYDWMLDIGYTPHLLVDAEQENVEVPSEFVQDGQIVLNIMPSAVRNFFMDDQAVSFNARFSGQPMNIYVPMQAILAIYAREDGQGMGFGAEPGAQCYIESNDPDAADGTITEGEGAEEKADATPKSEKKRATLKVIK